MGSLSVCLRTQRGQTHSTRPRPQPLHERPEGLYEIIWKDMPSPKACSLANRIMIVPSWKRSKCFKEPKRPKSWNPGPSLDNVVWARLRPAFSSLLHSLSLMKQCLPHGISLTKPWKKKGICSCRQAAVLKGPIRIKPFAHKYLVPK